MCDVEQPHGNRPGTKDGKTCRPKSDFIGPKPGSVELMAPARDADIGIAAVNCGADAVYIGAERFGARENAGNHVSNIERLVNHAHKYWARVYVTLNTLLRDDEIPKALRLIDRLYGAGIDGLVIQDAGLLECDLPPIPLIASTQMHNNTPEKVAFLENVGFCRAILARELSLEEIAAVRRRTSIELECFIHGALCVSQSGQCYLSYAFGGRSGNRGRCAQPCRRIYSLVDGSGKVLVKDRYLLSLKDLNLTRWLEALIQAGVNAFKIEGRLKDRAYVMNTVAHYRKRLDALLSGQGLKRTSSGESLLDFEPDLNKTFNRGYTPFFVQRRLPSLSSIHTPKHMGERIGEIVAVEKNRIVLQRGKKLVPGDGICFFSSRSELAGTAINRVEGDQVTPERMEGLTPGVTVYRSEDRAFVMKLEKSRTERTIPIRMRFSDAPGGFRLSVEDEDGNRAETIRVQPKAAAEHAGTALENIRRQLSKCGGTPFRCDRIDVAVRTPHFMPLAELNALRRAALGKLAAVREQNRPKTAGGVRKNGVPYPVRGLTYLGNVLNRKAEAFYRRHGVTEIDPAAESGLGMQGRKVMTAKYCLLHELGLCHAKGVRMHPADPLFLTDENGRRLKLVFRCTPCEMDVLLER